MGNFISVMTHCWGRGQEIILGDKAHIHLYEQGNIAQVSTLRIDNFSKKLGKIFLFYMAGKLYLNCNEIQNIFSRHVYLNFCWIDS